MSWKKTEHFKETEFGPMKTSHTIETIEHTDCSRCKSLEARLAESQTELARVREVCAEINREKNLTFSQSCLNLEKLTAANERIKELETIANEAIALLENGGWWDEDDQRECGKRLRAKLEGI